MHSMRAILFSVLLISLGVSFGCDRSQSSESSSAPGKHGSHDAHGHDHDHDHDHAEPKPSAQARSKHAHEESEHAEEITLTAEAVKKSGIRIDTVRKRVLVDMIHAPARVAFNAEAIAHVGSPLSGRVAQIKVKVGDEVKKGDALLVVQSPDLGEAQSDYLLKRMAAEAAGPAVDLAKSAHERARALWTESQGIALTEVQKREAEYKAALAVQLTAQAQATAAENRLHLLGMDQQAISELERTKEIAPSFTLRAPINGRVIEREATLGELVNPEREALLVLADMNTLWVLADVPETTLGRVTIGSTAQVTIPALPAQTLQGSVTFIAPTLDPNTRTISVRIEIKGDVQGLRPGMFAQAVITESSDDGKHEPVLAIPEEATQLVEGELVVFEPVEGEANTFAKRPVKVGRAVGKWLPVLSGLKEGQSLVTAGSFILKAEHGKASASHEH